MWHYLEHDYNPIRSLKSLKKISKPLEKVSTNEKKLIKEFIKSYLKSGNDDEILKKNRLELLQLLCKTFNNYINFSNIEST